MEKESSSKTSAAPILSVDVEKIESAVLRRIVREVRNERDQGNPHYYNRIHNRHNRS